MWCPQASPRDKPTVTEGTVTRLIITGAADTRVDTEAGTEAPMSISIGRLGTLGMRKVGTRGGSVAAGTEKVNISRMGMGAGTRRVIMRRVGRLGTRKCPIFGTGLHVKLHGERSEPTIRLSDIR